MDHNELLQKYEALKASLVCDVCGKEVDPATVKCLIKHHLYLYIDKYALTGNYLKENALLKLT